MTGEGGGTSVPAGATDVIDDLSPGELARLRLECVRLAAAPHRSGSEVVEHATDLAAFVFSGAGRPAPAPCSPVAESRDDG